jgi:hypothetical protein
MYIRIFDKKQELPLEDLSMETKNVDDYVNLIKKYGYIRYYNQDIATVYCYVTARVISMDSFDIYVKEEGE